MNSLPPKLYKIFFYRILISQIWDRGQPSDIASNWVLITMNYLDISLIILNFIGDSMAYEILLNNLFVRSEIFSYS